MARMNLSTEKKLINLENRLVVTKRGGEWDGLGDWKSGVNRCKLLPLEWISNEILLCSTGNYILSLVMQHDGG